MKGLQRDTALHLIWLYIRAIRIEYYIPYYFFAFMIAFLPSVVPYFKIDVRIILALLTFTGAGAYAMMVNNYYDYEIDKRNPAKNINATFVEVFGKFKIIILGLFNLILILISSIVLAYLIGKFILIILLVFGAFLAYIYSAEPVRLKKRHIYGITCKLFLIWTLQMLYIFYAYKDQLSLFDWLYISSASIFWTGTSHITDECADILVDRANKIYTFGLKIGPEKSAILMLLLTIFGGVGIGFYYFFTSAYYALFIWVVSMMIILFIMVHGFFLVYSRPLFEQKIKWFTHKSALFWAISVFTMLIGNIMEVI